MASSSFLASEDGGTGGPGTASSPPALLPPTAHTDAIPADHTLISGQAPHPVAVADPMVEPPLEVPLPAVAAAPPVHDDGRPPEPPTGTAVSVATAPNIQRVSHAAPMTTDDLLTPEAGPDADIAEGRARTDMLLPEASARSSRNAPLASMSSMPSAGTPRGPQIRGRFSVYEEKELSKSNWVRMADTHMRDFGRIDTARTGRPGMFSRTASDNVSARTAARGSSMLSRPKTSLSGASASAAGNAAGGGPGAKNKVQGDITADSVYKAFQALNGVRHVLQRMSAQCGIQLPNAAATRTVSGSSIKPKQAGASAASVPNPSRTSIGSLQDSREAGSTATTPSAQ